MDLLLLALTGIGFSAVVSLVIGFLILPPTLGVLSDICSNENGIRFWTRFAIIIIILGPLLVTLVFGLPSTETFSKMALADAILRLLKTALIGGFLTISGIGLRIASLRPPLRTEETTSSKHLAWMKKDSQ